MDNQRLFLWAGLAFILYLNYTTWMGDYAPAPAPQTETAAPAPEPSAADDLPSLPSAPATEGGDAQTPTLPAIEATAQASTGRLVHVRTDVLDVAIDTQGGALVRADVLDYPVHKDEPDVPVRLLDTRAAERFVIQSGLLGADGRSTPTHQAVFAAPSDEFVLADGAESVAVELRWQDTAAGLSAVKRYTFRRGRYAVELEQILENSGAETWTGGSYVQIRRDATPIERSMFDVDTYSFKGPVLYDGQKYEKLDVDDLRESPLHASYANGWIAAIQHHFLAAAVPPAGVPSSYEVRLLNGSYVLSATVPASVAPGARERYAATLFVGPKLQSQLEEVAAGLKLTVDYGWLTVIAQPLFIALEFVHGLVGNWGWAIIIITLLIKLVFYKLTEMSGRSMARMRQLQPRIKSLQERYKDDREALSKAMMEMYRKEKINPIAGCLPMLVQIPVFLAFYWVLLESVEMRQAPFALWITDLSSRDPFFILPLLMGAAMFGQFRLNPAPPDPVQAKVMMVMPVVMTGMMAFFPAGLVLYWLTNTLLSIAQQWRINRLVSGDG